MPNHVASNTIIHNYSLPESHYALWFYVSVDGDVSPQLVRRLLLDATIGCDDVLNEPTPLALVGDCTTRPFKYMVYVHFRDYSAHWQGKSSLFLSITATLKTAGISPAAVTYEIGTRESLPPQVQEPTTAAQIAGAGLFAHLTDDEIRILASHSAHREFAGGSTIVEEGAEGESLFIVSSGLIVIEKADEHGNPIQLAQLTKGACLGEMALLTGERRSATVRACSDCLLIEVPKDALAPLIEQKPDLASEFATMMAERLANQDARFNEASDNSRRQLLSQYASEALSKIGAFFGIK